jgi:hypothetical protein
MTPAQKRALAVLAGGGLLRERGRFGAEQADRGAAAPDWPSRQTVRCLLRDGLIEPGPYWGTYQRKGARHAPGTPQDGP